MKISIIIPSYNQAGLLEETLRSLLKEEGPKEVLVVDGGSTDGSVEILERYETELACWVSEPDRGQADAINKGLARMTGEVWMFLNSDDLLEKGALSMVREVFRDAAVDWVAGDALVFDQARDLGVIRPEPPGRIMDYLRPWRRASQYVFPFSGASFMRRSVFERLGGFDASLHYCMDIDYYLRAVFRLGLAYHHVPQILARWRRHSDSKTEREGVAYAFREEEVVLARRYSDVLTEEEREELGRDLRFEERQTLARKASFWAASGRRNEGWSILWNGLCRDPALLSFRPWWGAVRRCWSWR
ncbi:MAG: glycosyltransferase family 2 protein [Verrucomicrobiia bacterium]